MADSKISALAEATTLANTDEFVIATSGATKRVTFATLVAEVLGTSMEVLFDSTLGADAAAIDTGANGVAQTHAHLLIVGTFRTAQAAVGGQVNVTFNNDTGSNYDDQRVTDTNVTLGQGISLATTFIGLPVNGANALANSAGFAMMVVPHYRGTTFHKATLGVSSVTDDTAADRVGRLEWGGWRSTSAISRVAFTGNSADIVAGSRVTVFGLG